MASHKKRPTPGRTGGAVANFTGILSAFVIVFGGLFLVQGRLRLEQEKILENGGLVQLPQTGTVETAEFVEVSLRDPLTESELLQLVHNLEQKGEIKPHEPLEGQLTMVQAIDCGKAWLEVFFLSDPAACGLPADKYGTSCYLWALEAAEADLGASPWLSCWTVSLSNQNVDATLTLNAVSGQILDASITCSAPASHPDKESLLALLEKYALSFHLKEDDLLPGGDTLTNSDLLISFEDKYSDTNELLCYQSMGSCGIYAAIQTGSVIFIGADTDTEPPVYTERFHLHLYLSSGPKLR